MLRERELILQRIEYACQRLHTGSLVKERAIELLDILEHRAPDLIIRKNPNVIAAQIVCLVARKMHNTEITHTTVGNVMNTSAPSVGKYKHYLEPWVRNQHLRDASGRFW